MPIEIEPQLETNYAFAQMNSQAAKDEVQYTDEREISSYSPTSETKSKLNQNDPFGSNDNDHDKLKEDIIIPYIVETEFQGAQASSTTSSDKIGTLNSSKDSHHNPVENNGRHIDNTDGNITIQTEGKPATTTTATELGSLDLQIGTLEKNEDKNVNGGNSGSNSIVSNNKPNTENSQCELTASQPTYKSYRDYINNSSANKNENHDEAIISGDQSVAESGSTASTNSQVSAQSSSDVYGDFNGDGLDDLAIGVPGEGVNTGAGNLFAAGAVNVIYVSSNGLSATSVPDQFWTQDSPDVNDVAEAGDRFGFSLCR